MARRDRLILVICILATVLCIVAGVAVVKWQFSRFEQDLAIEIPELSDPEPNLAVVVTIEVLPNGGLLLDGNAREATEAKKFLGDQLESEPSLGVIITAKSDIEFERIVEVLNLVKDVGIANVSFSGPQ